MSNLRGQDAYLRHQRYVQSARLYGSLQERQSTTELDILRDRHRFLREDEPGSSSGASWEDELATKYYSALFKEFAVCDLKHYKSGDFALRWRTEDEVVNGAGQFTCANTRCAHHDPSALEPVSSSSPPHKIPPLITLEVPFGYIEDGEAKSALVKVVLCDSCTKKLLWKRNRSKKVVQQVPEVIQGDAPTGGSLLGTHPDSSTTRKHLRGHSKVNSDSTTQKQKSYKITKEGGHARKRRRTEEVV